MKENTNSPFEPEDMLDPQASPKKKKKRTPSGDKAPAGKEQAGSDDPVVRKKKKPGRAIKKPADPGLDAAEPAPRKKKRPAKSTVTSDASSDTPVRKKKKRTPHAEGSDSTAAEAPVRRKKRRPDSARKHPTVSPKRKRRSSQGKQLTPGRIVRRILLCVATILVFIIVGLLCAGRVAFLGPSQTMGDLLTVSMLETSALKWVPRLYYSQDKIDQIVARNSVVETDESTDTSLIVIPGPTPEPTATPDPDAAPAVQEEVTPEPTPEVQATPAPNCISDEDGIAIYEVRGGTYAGYMMVVQDPSRVFLGTSADKFTARAGLTLDKIAQRYNGVAAINGGAFKDVGGTGNGGQPLGLVISDGVMLSHYEKNNHATAVGFNKDNILIVQHDMTDEQAEAAGMRDCCAFGPALIINGEPAEISGEGSGLNPRTAIGQRSDGAVLMLVIDGRQTSSIGASYSDLIGIMMEYGAVNACNLDGGSSSMLYYNGKYINNGVELTGSRELPTAFVVR